MGRLLTLLPHSFEGTGSSLARSVCILVISMSQLVPLLGINSIGSGGWTALLSKQCYIYLVAAIYALCYP